jgi:signal transduction histidine kinase
MRRAAPVAVLAAGLALLVGSYVVYTQRLVVQLSREASHSGRMYARVFRALNNPREELGATLLYDLTQHIDSLGVPVIITDADGRPTAHTNLPFNAEDDDPRLRAYVRELDKQNPPIVEPGVGTVHFGNTPLVRGLRVIPIAQAAMLIVVILAGVYVLWARARADRERVWAGMARESAHQLGTPLSSLHGWIELLRDREGDAMTEAAVAHMHSDVERLERVAHRFERIGRPPHRELVDVGELVERVAGYFRARVPSLAHAVTVTSSRADAPLTVEGDPVLLEWALEALAKNGIDALAGRGGRLEISATALPEGGVRLRVADDGPGVPRELRTRVFEPGFSTKQRGWGIGLSLARRIIEENHAGRLLLVPSDRGATFDVILQ